ncbi:hypothetical protein, partial [Parafilimonas sp.]|uniref:hypothetical protein n=1 Tax=Parafilimonas sp. TaxID=1969739 RepID=UPI003F7DC80F
MRKVSHIFYSIILFLNLSETYRVLSWILSTGTSIISTVTLIINAIYIVINFQSAKKLFSTRIPMLWLFITLLFPVIMITLSFVLGFMELSEMGYWISFTALFGSLFVASAILAFNVSKKWILILIWGSVISTIIGFILNYTWFDLFRKIGDASNTEKAYVVYGSSLDRGVSFFVAPNRAAFTVICFLILLLTTDFLPKRLSYYLGCI